MDDIIHSLHLQATKRFRYDTINTELQVSIYDVIKLICQVENPRATWSHICTLYPIYKDVHYHQFPGAGMRLTPVASSDVILHVISVLPGKCALEYRNNNEDYRRLYRDRNINCLTHQLVKCNHISKPKLKNIKKPSPCWIYVRLLKDESLLKFGITINLKNRYSMSEGRYIASILMPSQKKARHIESVFCALLRNIVIDLKNEYISTEKFVQLLAMEKKISYEETGMILFGMISNMAHKLYPNNLFYPMKTFELKFGKIACNEIKDTVDLLGYNMLSKFFSN